MTAIVRAAIDEARCTGCGQCAKACPIDAVRMETRLPGSEPPPAARVARIDSICLGCGVCALKCPTRALKLRNRPQQVIHPADSFERVMLQALERDTLQVFLFDNPNSRTQAFMRALVGGFLKLPPVKRALLSEKLRSRLLSALVLNRG